MRAAEMTVDTKIDNCLAAEDSEQPSAADASVQADDVAATSTERAVAEPRRRLTRTRLVVFGLLPAIVLLLAAGAAYARWRDVSVREAQLAGIAAVQSARDGTVALLGYRPDTVENDLTAARERLTGTFRDSYTSLTEQVVIPGAQQKLITAIAKVPAAALVSATASHAVVLVFVDQTTTIGNGSPSDTASSVRVTLDKINNKWLISGFDPV